MIKWMSAGALIAILLLLLCVMTGEVEGRRETCNVGGNTEVQKYV